MSKQTEKKKKKKLRMATQSIEASDESFPFQHEEDEKRMENERSEHFFAFEIV